MCNDIISKTIFWQCLQRSFTYGTDEGRLIVSKLKTTSISFEKLKVLLSAIDSLVETEFW